MDGFKNKNRGYQQLRVWRDSIEFYRLTSDVFRKFPYELKRVSSQAMAASDSVHRNIAEGYCRRSVKEYLKFLYIALGSLGENVSGFHAYRHAEQITEQEFTALNELAFKLENGLLKLVESLEKKKVDGEWIDSLNVKESNESYTGGTPGTHYSITPVLQHSRGNLDGSSLHLSSQALG
jgi:four helix bundle protein